MNKKVVVIGGGTGLPALLRGIKYIKDIDISAIVTIADSGGSTGRLTQHFDIPAVGDLRRVIASLSRNREELEESMEYRISGTNSDLDGHTIGNFILASQIMMKNDFAEGIRQATKMLNVQGEVLPVSEKFEHLHAEMEDGSIIEGEDNIGHSKGRIKKVFYKEGKASSLAVKAIKEADYVIFGIGSLYTSLIANLIYKDIQDALKQTKGQVIYFANVFTQHGETDNFTLADHIRAIEEHTHEGVIDKIIVSNTELDADVLESYNQDGQELVQIDMDNIIKKDLIEVFGKNNAKHAEKKVQSVVEELIK